MTTVELDMGKVEEFGAQMASFLNGGAAVLMLSIGHQTGLFDVMAGLPPSTSEEIADAAGLDERYVREWLGAMVAAGVVEYDGGSAAYVLPPEHATLTTRAAGPNNFAAFAPMIVISGGVESEIIDKFRNGGGVPYSSFTRFHEALADVTGAVFDASLVSATLPLVPGIIERLEAGIEVADIATGSGHAINVMAKAFPKSNFVGYDFSDQALERGRAEAAAWGLKNASFEVKDVAELDDSRQFDFITTFDAVHDQAKPLTVVRGIHDALKAGSYWLCVDVRASSHVGENVDHPLGTLMYAISCTHCMTVSLAYDGEGLGAMWGVQKARELFTEAGFGSVQIHSLEGDPMNNYYVCEKSA